jgi:hypothetical protein
VIFTPTAARHILQCELLLLLLLLLLSLGCQNLLTLCEPFRCISSRHRRLLCPRQSRIAIQTHGCDRVLGASVRLHQRIALSPVHVNLVARRTELELQVVCLALQRCCVVAGALGIRQNVLLGGERTAERCRFVG